MSSECEMLDIEMTKELSEEELCKSLDAAMPDGIKIIKAERRTNHPDFFAIESAKYSIDFSSNKDIDTESFDSLDCYMIEKKSKRGMKEVNIRSTLVQRDQSGKRIPTGNNIFIQGNADIDLVKAELLLEITCLT